MLDVILPFKGKYNYINVLEKDILDIYHLKTSWYTIIGPFFLGYILGGKDIDENNTAIRICTSWATTEENVDKLIAKL